MADTGEYPTPIATVDVVLLTLCDGALSVVLLRREHDPYGGHLALPGGYVRITEHDSTEQTAHDVLARKLGIEVPYLEQLYTFSGPVRDPRGWSLSVSYVAVVPEHHVARDASEGVCVVPVGQLPPLPFDHAAIVAKALERVRNKATYSSLPLFLAGPTFTLTELRKIYEQVLGERIERTAFRRAMLEQGIIEPLNEARRGGDGRPAQIYRSGAKELQALRRTL